MRNFVCWAGLLGMLAVGCGQAKKSELSKPPIAPAPAETLYGPALVQGEAAVEPHYQGFKAAEWKQLLLDPASSYAARHQASRALAHLDRVDDLLVAMKDRSAEVRLLALQALQPHQAKQEEMAPYLIQQIMDMLKDPNPAIRQEAAFRLSWFDKTTSSRLIAGPLAKQRLDALQAIYHFDGNRQVQLAARNSIISLYDHMRGTLDCPPANNLFLDPE